MKALFISGTRRHTRPYFDVAARCRCFSLANELNCAGQCAMVVSQAEFEQNMARLENFDSYVFHRPSISLKLQEFIQKFINKRILIADFDDLLFDPAIARQISTVKKNLFSLEDTLTRISAISGAASLFDKFSLSTEPLKKQVEKIFRPERAVVIPNGLPAGFMGMCATARKKSPWIKRKYLFGYISGTLTHDRDFAMIKGLLLDKLRSAGQRMLLVGPVCEKDIDFNDKGLVTRQNLVPFSMVPQLMAQCQYLLAPLEDNIFNQAKSCIKFLEGAFCGCVVLATPIPDMARFESPLLIKCQTREDWKKAIDEARAIAPKTESALAALMPLAGASESARRFSDIFLQRGIY